MQTTDAGLFTCGLSTVDATTRLMREGNNELPGTRRRPVWRMAWEIVCEPMFLLLVACGLTYLLLGERQEAAMLLGFVFVVMGITFYQERKTERALEALRDLSSPRALVIRDGREQRIAGREVVRGDWVVLSEGDRVPADALVREDAGLRMDESLLTGESVPVRKRAFVGASWEDAGMDKKPGGDDRSIVYSGTMVVQGRGFVEVIATGINTELGRIGKALDSVEPERSQLQREIDRWVTRLAVAGLSFCALVFVVYGITRHDWLNGFLAGLTLAMAMLPEEFPVVLTIFLALGAWRIAQKNVLTRRIPAVESLGAATVLCVDKTGTLTANRMSVERLYADGQTCSPYDPAFRDMPEHFHELVEFSLLASQRDPFDPMEKAVHELGRKRLAEKEHHHDAWTLVREYPLSHELLALTHVWRSPDGAQHLIAAKGAPEAIFDLCHLDASARHIADTAVEAMASAGLRVLGVARTHFMPPALPGIQHDFNFHFLGLLGFADPVREDVPAAIQECQRAGLRVVMITGDYPATARYVARQIKIPSEDRLISGSELAAMSDETLRREIKSVHLFARVVPEQKLRIVRALQSAGEVVGMTGDGVNDAPALKAAHIGVAMGGHGTDVARESAALVLLDDNFTSIVAAVRLGRRIFDNLRKAMAYILAVHVPIAGLSLLPVLLHWPLILLPVHIVFLELIIDPACSVVFEAEPEEADVMNRPPRVVGKPLFSARMVALSVAQGLGVLLTVLGVFAVAFYGMGRSTESCRAMAFSAMVIANLGLILTNRSWSEGAAQIVRRPNRPQGWVTAGTLLVLVGALYVPFLQHLFKFAPLTWMELSACAGAGVVSVCWFEVFKKFRKVPL